MFVFTRSPQGSHQEPCPAQRGITLRQPFPEFSCFGVRLYQLINKPAPLGLKTLGPGPCSWPPNVQLTTKRAVDHQTCSLPPNAGQARRRFCSSSRPIRTLEVCGRISYCFYYVNFGIVWCYGYDKIVFYAYYFIFSVCWVCFCFVVVVVCLLFFVVLGCCCCFCFVF